jgi:hypothetical protein
VFKSSLIIVLMIVDCVSQCWKSRLLVVSTRSTMIWLQRMNIGYG